MAKSFLLSTLSLALLLALTFVIANSARLLDDVTQETPDSLPPLPSTDDEPTTALPSAQAPAEDTNTNTSNGSSNDEPDQVVPKPDDTGSPVEAASPNDEPNTPLPSTPSQGGAATSAVGSGHLTISFYMHDVLGGSHASGRIVTGLIATNGVNGIPFSRPNNQVFPVSNGVPLANNNLNTIFNNNNNIPSMTGFNGQNQQQSTQTVISNAGNNNIVNGGNNNQAFVTPGQLPSGVSLQKLMFGSITVIDDELTEGHELGSSVVGKGQGFYLASSLDGESHTMAFTALFPGEHGHDEDDTVSFFGVHRTASPISHIAVVGGTGKYENAKGHATIEALHQEDQHTTDGVDTISHISVYIY